MVPGTTRVVGTPYGRLDRPVDIRADGAVTIRPGMEIETFYHDLPAADAAHWAAKLRLHSVAAVATPVDAAGWRTIPSTYIATTDDRSVPIAQQRVMARHTDLVVDLPTGHSPFLSQPHLVAGILAGLAIE